MTESIKNNAVKHFFKDEARLKLKTFIPIDFKCYFLYFFLQKLYFWLELLCTINVTRPNT